MVDRAPRKRPASRQTARARTSTGSLRRPAGVLKRTTFRTSRLMEFCSRKELISQTGHPPCDWPLVILKELVDNALDACEEAGVPPEIAVTVDDDGITVADNGPGIPASTVESILDFSIRVSSREAYVAPDRGAQGLALKTILAMPYVLDGDEGTVLIEALGTAHTITMRVNPIRQEPVITHDVEPGGVAAGSRITVQWPASDQGADHDHDDDSLQEDDHDRPALEPLEPGSLAAAKDRFLQLAADYTWLNPHLTLTVDWLGEVTVTAATTPDWKKWKPNQPTSAHWWSLEHIERLIAGYIAHDQDNGSERTVRELVAEFNGLTATAKQKIVLEATGLHREPLSALLNGAGGLDHEKVAGLLAAMKENSRPVTPVRLGLIGQDHFEKRFAEGGCDMETFKYQKVLGESDGRPEILEVAFGWCPKTGDHRRLVSGVNWSAAIINPFRRLGETGRSLDTMLERLRCGNEEEVVIVMHIAMPCAEFTDRGKSALVMEDR